MDTTSSSTRISVSYSNKVNGRSLMVTITKDLPEGITEMSHIDSLENELRAYVDQKVESYKAVQEFDSFKQETIQQAPQPPLSTPQCPICRSQMKPSKNGNKWLCVNSKWRMVNGQFANSGCMGSLDR